VLLGPGTYGYELSGAGGGGGGGASNQFDCKSGNNGGDGGNGELKSGVFTLPTPTNVVFSIGGNVSGAGDCGHGGTDNGAPGEPSTIKHGNTTITAVGGGGGKWKGYGTSESPKAPSGAGAKGGLGGQKGGRNPQNGAAGWFILTSYAP
jgi:loricrin